jgi:hypothetical protein
MSNEPLPFSGKIADRVRKGVQGGLNVNDIFASIQSYQNAPGSLTTFYKLYREVLDEERAKINSEIGKKVIDQARAGDFKSQEFYLRSRGKWNPTDKLITSEGIPEEESNMSALDELAALMKRNPREE